VLVICSLQQLGDEGDLARKNSGLAVVADEVPTPEAHGTAHASARLSRLMKSGSQDTVSPLRLKVTPGAHDPRRRREDGAVDDPD
jgi:hypothetical protein